MEQLSLTKMNVTVYDNDAYKNEEKLADMNISGPYGSTPYHPITSFIEVYTIPVISLFGILGNTLSSVVFLQKPLRNSSCSIFLAARGFSDNGFLSTLLIIWISRTFQLQLGTVSGSCRIIIFFSYVCGCISVWLVVFVALENYIRVCKPMLVNRVCKTTIAEASVAVLCIVTIAVYNFPFWTMNALSCIIYEHFDTTVQVYVYIDTLLTLAIPLLFLIIFISAILCELIKSFNRRKRLHASLTSRQKNPLAKVTTMLFAVTVTFFCLNLPSHVNRLRNLISSFVDQKERQRVYSLQEEAIQQITLLVYYLSLSTNIIVYVLFGHRFRSVLRGMCCISPFMYCSKEKDPEHTTTQLLLDKHPANNIEITNNDQKADTYIEITKDSSKCHTTTLLSNGQCGSSS